MSDCRWISASSRCAATVRSVAGLWLRDNTSAAGARPKAGCQFMVTRANFYAELRKSTGSIVMNSFGAFCMLNETKEIFCEETFSLR